MVEIAFGVIGGCFVTGLIVAIAWWWLFTRDGETEVDVEGPEYAEPLIESVIRLANGTYEAVPQRAADILVDDGNELLAHHDGDAETLERAAEVFARVVSSHPERVEGWVGLAEVGMLACDCGEDTWDLDGLGRAEAWVRHALELNPSDDSAIAVLAEYRLLQGHMVDAVQLVAKCDETSWRSHYVRGRIAQVNGDVGIATTEFNTAVRNAPVPRQPGLYLALGRALLEEDRVQEALDAFDQALRMKADLAWAWHYRAFCLFKMRRDAEALESVQQALAILHIPQSEELYHQIVNG